MAGDVSPTFIDLSGRQRLVLVQHHLEQLPPAAGDEGLVGAEVLPAMEIISF